MPLGRDSDFATGRPLHWFESAGLAPAPSSIPFLVKVTAIPVGRMTKLTVPGDGPVIARKYATRRNAAKTAENGAAGED